MPTSETDRYDHWSAAPFRGLKRDIYDGGHHVPFLIRWPGITAPGSLCDALVSQIDLMATLAALVEFDLPADQAEDSHNPAAAAARRSRPGPHDARPQHVQERLCDS